VKRFVVVGLAWLAASAAQAQTTGPAPAPAPAPSRPVQGPALPGAGPPAEAIAPCVVSTKVGDQYLDSPLVGFDPAAPGPLPVLQANSGAVMVACARSSLIPRVSDYRVLTEMHLPFAIKTGDKTLLIGVKGGQVQFAFPNGDATPEEMTTLRAVRDQMQSAMTAKTAAK
jgi:hypothetical protein